MRVQNVNTNNQNRQNFKMNCTARVEQRVFETLQRQGNIERTNLAQKMIDTIEAFKQGVSKLGTDSDEAILHFGWFGENHVNLFLNKKPLTHIKLYESISAEDVTNALFQKLPANSLNYKDAMPKIAQEAKTPDEIIDKLKSISVLV